MKIAALLIMALLIASQSAFALSKKEVKTIIKDAYPGARIKEIEKEKYQGNKIYEVDFKHDGKSYEAIISLDGEIIKVEVDDDD